MNRGEIAEHVLSKDWVLVLDKKQARDGEEKYVCRTKALEMVEFFAFELRPRGGK